jgi:acetyl esterase
MPLDPLVRSLLEKLSPPGAPGLHEIPLEMGRQAMEDLMCKGLPNGAEPVADVTDRTIPGPAGDVPIRIYTPEGKGPFPVVLYFHGGGWVMCSIKTHDGTCRALAHHSGCIVVAVDFRLAPEHKYPAPLEDCYAAAQWVSENAASFGGDPSKIAVAGDSSGGNMAAGLTLMARDRGGPKIGFQVLVYPSTSSLGDTASLEAYGEGYMMPRGTFFWAWTQYVRNDADRRDPYAAPRHAEDLRGLPPALVITAEFDPLRDEGEAYGERLKQADVPTEVKRFDGMIHGFFTMSGTIPQGKDAVKAAAQAIRKAFGVQ